MICVINQILRCTFYGGGLIDRLQLKIASLNPLFECYFKRTLLHDTWSVEGNKRSYPLNVEEVFF